MRYSRYLLANEREKEKNGEREKMTYQQMRLFIGDHDNLIIETLLDIANDQYPLDDFVREVHEHWKECNE